MHPYASDEPHFRPDRFLTHAALTSVLRGWAERFPSLVTLEALVTSPEGREVWCVTLTNSSTGPANGKPAYYVDANIHAGEVTGSAVALATLDHLLEGHGTDPRCTRILDRYALYVVPRVAVDGAERYLTTADFVRSAPRPFPRADAPEGLRKADVDGDGWIATLRLRDPAGAYRVSQRDPRLLVPRAPDEVEGEFYRVLPEGLISDHDPERDGLVGEVRYAPSPHGLDLNRNFPFSWEGEQRGGVAGRYPLSEPETRAVADFLFAHPNIVGCQHYHTFCAAILRPSSLHHDQDLPPADLARFEALGAMGTAETGYPCISLLDDFTADARHPYRGLMVDWSYEHLGVLSYSTELWSLALAAGVEVDDLQEFWFRRGRDEEAELAMLRWLDAHLDGFGYLPWRPFDHPQLGPVEIGGWLLKAVVQNAPGPVLADLNRRHVAFTLRAIEASPRLVLRETAVLPLGDGDADADPRPDHGPDPRPDRRRRTWRVQAVVENLGYLPTNVTEAAKALAHLRPDRLVLEVPDGVTVVGDAEREVGWVPGRDGQDRPVPVFLDDGIANRRKVEWIVSGPAGAVLTVRSVSLRGGTDRREVVL